MPSADRCHASEGEPCSSETVRWECAQLAGWMDAAGRGPWEQMGLSPLQFLSMASSYELAELADRAVGHLTCGTWEGYPTPTGGWADRDSDLDRWHAVASDFMARHAAGERHLTEGLIAGAAYDLACELAHLRGWCPRSARAAYSIRAPLERLWRAQSTRTLLGVALDPPFENGRS